MPLLLLLVIFLIGCSSTNRCPASHEIKVIQNGVWLDTVLEPVQLPHYNIRYIYTEWPAHACFSPLFVAVTDTDVFYIPEESARAILRKAYADRLTGPSKEGAASGFVYMEVLDPTDATLRDVWINQARITGLSKNFDKWIISVPDAHFTLLDAPKWLKYVQDC